MVESLWVDIELVTERSSRMYSLRPKFQILEKREGKGEEEREVKLF